MWAELGPAKNKYIYKKNKKIKNKKIKKYVCA
jgi:hypothetical protein